MLRVILSNWSDTMDLATKATETQGNALENQQKYLDSYTGKLQGASTALDTLKLHLLDSDAFKDGIDGITSLIQVLDKLISTFGTLPVASAALGAVFGAKNVGGLKIA